VTDSKRKEEKNRMFAWAYGRRDEELSKQFAERMRKHISDAASEAVGTTYVTWDTATPFLDSWHKQQESVIDLDPTDWHEVPILKELPSGNHIECS